MIGTIQSYAIGLGSHTLIDFLRSGSKGIFDFLKFLAINGTEERRIELENEKIEAQSQGEARNNKNPSFQRRVSVVGYIVLGIGGLLLLLGGLSHFAVITQEPRGWLLSPFLGAYHYVTHEFTHTFVMTPSFEDLMSGVVGFFSGHIARR